VSLFEKIRYGLEAAAVLLLLGWAWSWYARQGDIPVGVTVEASPSSEVKNVPTVAVEVKSIKVFTNRDKVVRDLKLPERVATNKEVEVLASSQVKADTHPSTVTTVINKETGASETFIRRDPLPWFAFQKNGRVGAYYGTSQDGAAAMLLAEQDLLAIKALKFSAIGTVIQNTNPNPGITATQGFVGIGGRVEW